MKTRLFLPLVLSLAWSAPVGAAPVEVDPDLPSYQVAAGVSGNLNSIGSDTLSNLMTLWAEAFRARYPNVTIQVESKGSSTAPPALMNGLAQLGPMSRPMKSEEIDAFEAKFGYKPTEIKVGIDALAVFAHKDNPIQGLTMAQLDGIFSSTRKSGSPDLTEWGPLGIEAWRGRPISLYGRNSASGTYGFFKEHALQKGDFKPSVKEQPGSSAVVQGVAADLFSLGFSGIGYQTSGVRSVPLREGDAGSFAEPTYENCLDGSYPLARFLLVYVNKKPNAPIDLLTKEFLRFVVSKEGQEVVVKDGYFPIPSEVASEAMQSVE